MRRFILGIDEGTTSLRSVLYDVDKQKIVDYEGSAFKQFFPKPAWVEHDAEEISTKVLKTAKTILKRNDIKKGELLGIGLTNQRETVVAWDKTTGKPIYHAIVWQCRRTSDSFKNFKQKDLDLIKQKTGLIANPYFSASKMRWILDNVPASKDLLKKGRLCFGTIDSFLAFKLTGNHVTDVTNASRTLLMNIHTLSWDDELLKMFKIPKETLPKILDCDYDFGYCKALGAKLCSMIGDQQSSMVGQGAIENGNTKITFGTGGFILTNIGQNSNKIFDKLLTTVAFSIEGKTYYAIEGSIYSACSSLEWLQKIGLFDDVSKTSEIAKSVKDNEGVYFVPAFTGLGAPYWRDDARASLVGVTFQTQKSHIIRAFLESMAYNTRALFDEMKKNGQTFKKISVDGGGSKNEFLLQFLADMLNHEIYKSGQSEATSLGAIYVAMINLKLIDKKDIEKLSKSNRCFKPNMDEKTRRKNYDGWKNAVEKI